ncbi:MAG: hypothetical protein J0L82_10110 [Deltaproteobacteria bacterium]|jgi:hypothetical protein|nr:hypothetical protein [Deltaproteobacteria bacterium]
MIPKLDLIEKHHDLAIWQTTDGAVGASCLMESIDIETCDRPTEHRKFESALQALPAGIIVKLETSCALGESPRIDSSRSVALLKTGFRNYETIVHIQTNRNPFLELVYRQRHGELGPRIRIEQAARAFRDAGIELKPLGDIATCELFENGSAPWVLNRSHVLKGQRYLGVVRLYKPVGTELSTEAMSNVLGKLPAPYKFTVQFQKSAKERAQIGLRRRFRQSNGDGKVSLARQEAVESTIQKTALQGHDLFDYEMLVSIERDTESDLNTSLLEAAGILRVFGDVIIETVGVGPSFLATLPGIGLHVPLLEVSSTLPVFLPVWRTGQCLKPTTSSSLVLHRRDLSLDEVSLLDWSNQNATALIIGSSGRGKSALLGCLTEALLRDPYVKVIKVDVGGSHSKECALLGGEEYRLNLQSQNGLNPFSLVGEDRSETVRSILGSFVETLVLEDGERRLPKAVRVEIDEFLKQILEKRERPSIEDLLKVGFSRKHLLARWGLGGLYGKPFSSRLSYTPARLRYFNFQDIFQAKEEDFARAVMASVLSVFNMEMWLEPESRLVLICDETPFFIESCFDFFKTSSANVRKFGGSVILVAQTSKHLVFEGDTSLIENAGHRLLFSSDGDLTEFQERFRLRDQDMRTLSSLRFQSRRFSEFVYQKDSQAKAMRLELSQEEYWRVTSSQQDRMKLTNLIQAVPGLSTEEAIRCLSVRAGQF